MRALLLTTTALTFAALPVVSLPALAQDATWSATPGSGDFNTATNWSPGTVPVDTAFFGASTITSLSIDTGASANTGGWTFNAGASSYSFTNSGTTGFYGTGITVNGGSVAITNSNVLEFHNSSTAGSATITNDYVLDFYGSSTAGSAAITNSSALYFFNTSTAGSATITNNAGMGFYGSSTAGSATISNNAFLYFLNTSTAGSATITTNNNLYFYDTSTAGSAAITNTNSGGLIFYSASTAGSATITNNAGMAFYGNSTAGSATITNNATGYVDFSNSLGPAGDGRLSAASIAGAGNYLLGSNELTVGGNNLSTEVSGMISGTGGALVKTGTGTLTLSGPNTYDGGTTINGGTIAVAADTGLGAATGALAFGGGTLRFNAAFDLAATRAISLNAGGGIIDTNGFSTGITQGITGSGGLTKAGAGTLTLAGLNSYSGTTTVNGGTLAVNGSIAASSSVIVNAGGTLGGIGTVGSATITSGGTLAPGNSIGTLNVNGNLTFGSGSFYGIEVSPSAADRTNVTGTATLTGATVQAQSPPGSFRSQSYTILNAGGGLVGTFAGLSVTGRFNPVGNARLTYDPNNVFLVIDPGSIVLPAGANLNQSNVAGSINRAAGNGATPPAGFDALLNMTEAQLGNALTQASGEIGANTRQASFDAMNQFFNVLLDPTGSHDGTPDAALRPAAESRALGYAPVTTDTAARRTAALAMRDISPASPAGPSAARWSNWAAGYGGATTTAGKAATGSHDTTSRIYGTAMGADYRFSPDTRLGFALGLASFNFNTSGGSAAAVPTCIRPASMPATPLVRPMLPRARPMAGRT